MPSFSTSPHPHSHRLDGKTVLVTGGSRGIGAAIAKELAQNGARVAITFSTQESKAQDVLKTLTGEGHLCFRLDVTNEESVCSCFSQVIEGFGHLDALVNNAGITKDQILLRMSLDDFDHVITTNLRGTFLCTKQAAKHMLKNKAGSIVNITSIIGQIGNIGQANYAASKAGIEGFSKSVALELARKNIRINCIAPGFIKTDMTDQISEAVREEMLKKIPMHRLAEANNVGQAVTFLISDESNYVTGQTINVNGGLFMN